MRTVSSVTNLRDDFKYLRSKNFDPSLVITFLLRSVGTTPSTIAKDIGITSQMVSMTISGKRNNPAVKAAISQALGFDPWA